MARKKSATRRNKNFKSVDPFAKGKSTKGLGQDVGFGYGGRPEIGSEKKMLQRMKGSKVTKPKQKEAPKKKTAVHKLLSEGRDNPDVNVKFVKRSYESNREFLARMQHECDNTIKMTNANKQRNMAKEYIKATKHDKKMAKREKDIAEGKTPDDADENYGLQRKAKYRKELAKREVQSKAEKKLNSELEVAEREAMVDKVAFGERVDEPPQFSGKWAKTRKSNLSSLLLMDKLKPPEHNVIDKKKDLENERQRAIDAYRKMKGRERL